MVSRPQPAGTEFGGVHSSGATHLLFEVSQALDEEDRRDHACEEIVEHHSFVEIQAFKRRLVEDEIRPLHDKQIMALRDLPWI